MNMRSMNLAAKFVTVFAGFTRGLLPGLRSGQKLTPPEAS